MLNIFAHFRARRELSAVAARTAQLRADIESTKADAQARLAVAEIRLATAIADHALAPIPFRRAYAAEIRARQFIRDRLVELAQ